MDSHTISSSEERVLEDRELDFWGTFLDIIPSILYAWKLIVVATLAAGAIAYYVGASKTFSSISYVGPFDEPKAKFVDSVIRSEPVLKAVLDQFPDYPKQGMLDASRRQYLAHHTQIYPAEGSDPKRPSLYVLEISDSDPSKLQDILSRLIDTLLPATKPRPDTAARLERLLDATQVQVSDLSSVLKELLKHPELILPKPGYFPPNVADIIRLRAESISRAEDIRSELEGMSKDVVFSRPGVPSVSTKRGRIMGVIKVMGATFAVLLVIVVFRHVLIASMRSSFYGPKMKRIREALPWQTAAKSES
jgi:hypothetical protein